MSRTLSDDEAKSIIGEGLHTGLRKGTAAPSSAALWQAISDSDDGAWTEALDFLVWGLHEMGITLVQEDR
jgi:hypothetical protein